MPRLVADSAEIVGLGAFLRSRCGSLKTAFSSLDTSGVGHIDSGTFVTGVRALGYKEDAEHIFRSLDTESEGLVTLRSFLMTFGDEENGSENDNKSTLSFRSSRKDCDATKDTGRVGILDAAMPRSLTSAAFGPEFSERFARLEAQVASEQSLRQGAEKLFAQRVNNLVVAAITEQADKLREMIVHESSERKSEASLMQSNLDALRTEFVTMNLDSRLEALRNQIESRMQTIWQKSGDPDSRFTEVSKAVMRLEGGLNGAIARSEEQIAEMRRWQARGLQEMSTMKSQLHTLSTACTSLPDGGGLPLLVEMENLKGRVDSLSKDVKERDVFLLDCTRKVAQLVKSSAGGTPTPFVRGMSPVRSTLSQRTPSPGTVRAPRQTVKVSETVTQNSECSVVRSYSPASPRQDGTEKMVVADQSDSGVTHNANAGLVLSFSGLRGKQPAQLGSIDTSAHSTKSSSSAGANQHVMAGSVDTSTQSSSGVAAVTTSSDIEGSAKFGSGSVQSDQNIARFPDEERSAREPEVLNAIKALREEVLRLNEQQDKEEKQLKGRVSLTHSVAATPKQYSRQVSPPKDIAPEVSPKVDPHVASSKSTPRNIPAPEGVPSASFKASNLRFQDKTSLESSQSLQSSRISLFGSTRGANAAGRGSMLQQSVSPFPPSPGTQLQRSFSNGPASSAPPPTLGRGGLGNVAMWQFSPMAASHSGGGSMTITPRQRQGARAV